jgi:AsmA family/TamB, inner membrane protein subunit of TAM complex
MRRGRFWFNFTLLIVPPVVIGTGATILARRIWAYLNTDAHLAGLISTEATRALGREVKVGDIKFLASPWSLLPNRVELRDISIAQYPTLNSALFAHADKVVVWYDVRQIISPADNKTPLVKEVQVVGPQATLSRDAQGHWNFEQIFKPTQGTGRPFADKFSFLNARLDYSDQSFPHPVGVPRRPFVTHLDQVSGVVLVRPDKSAAFDVAGRPDPALLQDFHATGIASLTPLHIDARLIAHRANLPVVAARLLPANRARVQSGKADVDVSALYSPPAGTPLAAIDLSALDLHGTVQADNLFVTAPQLEGPLENVRLNGTFTNDSFAGSAAARYAGVIVDVQGQAIGLLRREVGPQGRLRTVLALPTVSLQGRAGQADIARVLRGLHLDQRLASISTLTPAIRRQIVSTTGQVRDVEFQVVGALNNPTVSAAAHIGQVRSFGFGAQNADLRGLLDNRIVTTDIRGKVEGGDLAARARVLTQEPGTFDVEAHARRVPLASLRPLIKRDIGGRGELDLAMRGRRRETPFISAQAQAFDVTLNKQSIHSVTIRAATVGSNLVVRQARLDDPKGFALATGTIGLRSQQLKLDVAADNLDLHALAAAASPMQKGEKADTQADPASNTASNTSSNASSSPLFDLNAVQGQGFFRGRVEGTVRNPEVAGRVSAFGIQAGQASLDRVITDFSLSKDALVIAKGVAERYPGQMTFSGRVSDFTSGDPDTRLQARAENVDIPDLLRLVGAQSMSLGAANAAPDARPLDKYVILGSVTTDPVRLQGRLKSLRLAAPVTVRGSNVSINGLPVTNLSATATLNNGDLQLQTARADVAGGTIRAAGSVSDIASKLDAVANLNIAATNLDAAQLTNALPPDTLPLTVTGTLNLKADLRGPLNKPLVTATLDARNLLLVDDKGGAYDVGNVHADAAYQNNQFVVNDAVVSEAGAPAGTNGLLTLQQFAYDPKSKTLSGVAQWNTLRLQRIRELFLKSPFAQSDVGLQVANNLNLLSRPLLGSITGQARIGGTLDAPTVDVTWNTSNVQIEDHPISLFAGSALVSKSRVRIPSPSTPEQIVRLQSDDLDIAVPNLDAVLNDGPLSGELRANKLNLASLHYFYNSSQKPDPNEDEAARAARKNIADRLASISGGGTADIVASGTTRSPIIDASINLHNVAYRDPVSKEDQVINRIDVSHLTVREGKIDTDIIEVLKTGTDKDTQKDLRFEANARGTIDFSWKPPYFPKNAQIDVTATVPEQSVNVLSVFKRDLNITSDGRFSLSARLSNTLDDPRVFGALKIDASKLQLGTTQSGLYRTGLRDIRGEIDFVNDIVRVRDGFTARTQVFGRGDKKDDPKQTGSPILLSGSLPLKNDSLGGRIELREDRVVFDETPLPGSRTGSARGEAGVRLNVTGTVLSPTIGGLVTVAKTTLTPPSDFGAGTGAALAPPIIPTFSQLLVTLGKDVWIKNPELNARVEGTISINGPLFVKADNTAVSAPAIPPPALNAANTVLPFAPPSSPLKLGLTVVGRLNIPEGRLTLPTARFTILPPGHIVVSYPAPDASANGVPTLGIDVDLQARSRITATSLSGIRKLYTVTVAARGPITGATLDPLTGDSRLALNFTTDPNDLAVSQQALQQRLAGVLGGDALGQFGRNPGQVLAQQLTNVFTSSIVPSLFDRPAQALGFDELAVNYDPIQRFNFIVSRQIFGPFYVTYNRTLGTIPEMYTLKVSARFRDRYQLSYEQNELNEQRTLLEGVWRY